ncbi:MAG: hypothetical protein GX080_06210 [Tissierellia bacterium]|nr:hypothetical protein [Tissierellia bacterium]
MDQVIREIISIDKETLNMKERYEELLKEKESQLKKTLADLEKASIENLYKPSSNGIDMTVELKNLEDIYIENMHNIDKVYKELKVQLIEDIWNDLF